MGRSDPIGSPDPPAFCTVPQAPDGAARPGGLLQRGRVVQPGQRLVLMHVCVETYQGFTISPASYRKYFADKAPSSGPASDSRMYVNVSERGSTYSANDTCTGLTSSIVPPPKP